MGARIAQESYLDASNQHVFYRTHLLFIFVNKQDNMKNNPDIPITFVDRNKQENSRFCLDKETQPQVKKKCNQGCEPVVSLNLEESDDRVFQMAAGSRKRLEKKDIKLYPWTLE